jgi:hypothetical protein
LPYLSPYPQLLETQVKSLTWDYFKALIKFIGTPEIPKPPTNNKELSLISLVASLGQVYILENK